MRFSSIYPNKWESQFVDDNHREITKEEWSLGLAGVSGDQIKGALHKCRTALEWPPSIAEFRNFCLNHGMPEPEEAFKAAINKQWIHPLVEAAHKKISSWDWSHDTDAVLRRKFSAAYKESQQNMLTTPKPKSTPVLGNNPYMNALEKLYRPIEHELVAELGAKLEKAGFGPYGAGDNTPAIKNDVSPNIIIDRGTDICKLLKKYNPHLGWPKISEMFAKLVKEDKKRYPGVDYYTILQGIEGELIRTHAKPEIKTQNDY